LARGQQRQQQQVEGELQVGSRLLAIHAVGRVLQQRLALEDLARRRAPLPRARPVGPCRRAQEEARGLADQVVVGRGMQREVPGDELGVLVNGLEPA
jgi:hypothetical protein